jgi:hypothetical protein
VFQIYNDVVAQSDDSSEHSESAVARKKSDLSEGNSKAVIEFSTASLAIMENEGKVRVGIKRYGKLDCEVSVRYV